MTLLIIGCTLLRPCFFFWQTHRRLRLHGITVQGSVIERHLEHLSNGQPWYYLTYHYMYEGQLYVTDQAVWRHHYESGESLVSVCCLPSTPEIATVFWDDFQRVEWVQKTILAMILFLVGTFILIGFLGLFPA